MTQTIVSQRPLDLQAAKVLAAHWLDRLLSREESDPISVTATASSNSRG